MLPASSHDTFEGMCGAMSAGSAKYLAIRSQLRPCCRRMYRPQERADRTGTATIPDIYNRKSATRNQLDEGGTHRDRCWAVHSCSWYTSDMVIPARLPAQSLSTTPWDKFRRTGDSISNLVRRHQISDGNDLSRALMSHDNRFCHRSSADSSREVIMQIRPADPCCPDKLVRQARE